MSKTALITGASSGIGYETAQILSSKGYDLILVARREDKLKKLQSLIKTKSQIILKDLSDEKNCFELYEQIKDENIEVLINNAGFGIFGEFTETDLSREIELINVNIKAVHILTKLFLKEFKKRNYGYIMNVASSASFMPGPLMATYYASKTYVLNLTRAIDKELKKSGSKVKICTLCPGPTDTEFNDVAHVKFGVKSVTALYVANYGIEKMFSGKTTIIPTLEMKLGVALSKLSPTAITLSIVYRIQKAKLK